MEEKLNLTRLSDEHEIIKTDKGLVIVTRIAGYIRRGLNIIHIADNLTNSEISESLRLATDCHRGLVRFIAFYKGVNWDPVAIMQESGQLDTENNAVLVCVYDPLALLINECFKNLYFSNSDLNLQIKLLRILFNAVNQLHSHNLIHGDIKPLNLLVRVNKSGEYVAFVIKDYKYVRMIGQMGNIAGYTRGYASSELIQDGDLPASVLVDIFALGATIIEILTKPGSELSHEPPVAEGGLIIKAYLDKISGTYGNNVLRVLQRATALNPSERYQTVMDFWNDLEKALRERL